MLHSRSYKLSLSRSDLRTTCLGAKKNSTRRANPRTFASGPKTHLPKGHKDFQTHVTCRQTYIFTRYINYNNENRANTASTNNNNCWFTICFQTV